MNKNKINLQSALVLADAYARFSAELYKSSVDLETYHALRDSLSQGQIFSKLELIQAALDLDLKLDRCLFIGHWHGLLPLLMKKMNLVNTSVGLEQSLFWSDFSKQINFDWPWTSHCANAEDLKCRLLYSDCDAVVNTSCEHMSAQWVELAPAGKIIIAQTTNYQIPEHINTCQSIDEFKNKLKLTSVLFHSEKKFSVYTRFTIVGIK